MLCKSEAQWGGEEIRIEVTGMIEGFLGFGIFDAR